MRKIDTIIQTSLGENRKAVQMVLHAAQQAHVNYTFVPGEPEFYSAKNSFDLLAGYPLITVSPTPLVGWSVILKRVFDLFAVVVMAPIWLIVMLFLVVCQKSFNRGPVFYKQVRVTRYGKMFRLMKFRSMNIELAPPGSNAIADFERMGRKDLVAEYKKARKIKNDPRVTSWIGQLLRKSSLDELPQILNVIRGDMSLVGPRPILPDEIGFYEAEGPLLLSVKPGITGLWQTSGRSETSFEERVRLELVYASDWSFGLDLQILLKTVPVVLFKKGAE